MVNDMILWAVCGSTGDVRRVSAARPLKDGEIPFSTSRNVTRQDVFNWVESESRVNACPSPLIDRRRRAAASAVT
jgi:hypothetical protein